MRTVGDIFVRFFFFQAEDGIRDKLVTGVQTCALPIWPGTGGTLFLTDRAILELKYPQSLALPALAKRIVTEFNLSPGPASKYRMALRASQIGRASCRERV